MVTEENMMMIPVTVENVRSEECKEQTYRGQ